MTERYKKEQEEIWWETAREGRLQRLPTHLKVNLSKYHFHRSSSHNPQKLHKSKLGDSGSVRFQKSEYNKPPRRIPKDNPIPTVSSLQKKFKHEKKTPQIVLLPAIVPENEIVTKGIYSDELAAETLKIVNEPDRETRLIRSIEAMVNISSFMGPRFQAIFTPIISEFIHTGFFFEEHQNISPPSPSPSPSPAKTTGKSTRTGSASQPLSRDEQQDLEIYNQQRDGIRLFFGDTSRITYTQLLRLLKSSGQDIQANIITLEKKIEHWVL